MPAPLSAIISALRCLVCPSRLAISFWDFYRPHHSPISYVLYLDKVLPETANQFDTPHSACCCSPQSLEKVLIRHGSLGNECFPGYLSRVGSKTRLYLPVKRGDFSETSQLPAPIWESEFYLVESLLKSQCINISRGIYIIKGR